MTLYLFIFDYGPIFVQEPLRQEILGVLENVWIEEEFSQVADNVCASWDCVALTARFDLYVLRGVVQQARRRGERESLDLENGCMCVGQPVQNVCK